MPTRDLRAADQPAPDFLRSRETLSASELNQGTKRTQELKAGKLASAKQDCLTRMKAEGEQLGLDLGSLFGGSALAKRRRKAAGEPKAGRPSVAAKYRSPTGAEWSRRGRI